MQLPLPGRVNVQYGNSLTDGIRQQVNNQFIDKIIMKESPEQFQWFKVTDFGKVGEGIVPAVFLTKQVQNGMGQYKGGTAFPPTGKTVFMVYHPLHWHIVVVRQKAVQCHRRYCLYSRHARCLKRKSVVATHSDRGSGKPKGEHVTPRYAGA